MVWYYGTVGTTYMVPPAFTEVWQLMFQSVLQDLKHNAEHPAEPVVT